MAPERPIDMRITRLPVALLAAVGLLVASCGDDPAPASDDASEPDLTASASDDATEPDATLPAPGDQGAGTLDGPWLLVSGTVDGSPVALVDGWDVTLTIDGDQVGGTAACNGYGGTVDTTDGAFMVADLGWTEKGCEPSVMDLEQAFLQSLMTISSYDLVDGVLTLGAPSAEWVFVPVAPVPDSEIVDTTWILDTYLDGDAATNMSIMELATLTLNADGTLTGSTSCRQLQGEWIATGSTVQFTSFAAIDDPTAGVCTPESQTLDGLIISVLESGFTVEIDGNRMTLTAAGNEGLSYRAVEAEAESPDGFAALDPAGGADGPVAYARHDPSAPSDRQTSATVMAALIEGVLELDGDCLYVAVGAGRAAVLWPFGTTWQSDPAAVILPNGDTVAVGGELSGGGGYLQPDSIDQFAGGEPALDVVTRCAEDPHREIAVLQSY